MKSLLLLALVFTSGCSVFYKSQPHSGKGLIAFEFNKEELAYYGIPSKKLDDLYFTKRLINDTLSIRENGVLLFCKKITRDTLFVALDEGNYKAKGRLLLLDLYSSSIETTINLESTDKDVVRVNKYNQPLRVGNWIFEENGQIREKNYNYDLIKNWR